MKRESNLNNIKYMGYCLSQLPPQQNMIDFEDFLQFAKFQLCESRKILLKDPIWDSYTKEEILIEYFAMVFSINEDFKKSFENFLNEGYEDSLSIEEVYDWFDEQIEKDNREKAEKEAEFSFKPEDVK